ncbi:hypothetical protein QR680_001045 [Steinernema hermaphroditum]|uniref:Methyltransferase FkbM domain-containing protein n=1 Tax=Steinernema hermaphroditum TaxID=289476 RepID=A0AA39GWX8_9BILA|nr:hypothetical protein QR680_001045 [Steinernema hermaphroditum]
MFYLKRIVLLVVAIFILTICISLISRPNDLQYNTTDKPFEQANLLRLCIIRELKHSKGPNYEKLNGCVRKHSKVDESSFEGFHMGRLDEIKYFLPITSGFDKRQCRWLTIGIGGDSRVEKELKEKYPECAVYGIEPVDQQVSDFGKYGTVIPRAVGPTSDNLPMKVRNEKGGYDTVTLHIEPLSKLLDQFVQTRLIHYATLDIEGFEFPILESMRTDGVIHKENVVLCQLDVELHNRIQGNHVLDADFDVNQFLGDFVLNSPYTPIRFSPFLHHIKMTAIRLDVPACQEAFGWSSYFS